MMLYIVQCIKSYLIINDIKKNNSALNIEESRKLTNTITSGHSSSRHKRPNRLKKPDNPGGQSKSV